MYKALQDFGIKLRKKEASNIMVRLILQNIEAWRKGQPQIQFLLSTTDHENALNQAVMTQNRVGWHQYLRGMYTKEWNMA